jgi:hypothetical protein
MLCRSDKYGDNKSEYHQAPYGELQTDSALVFSLAGYSSEKRVPLTDNEQSASDNQGFHECHGDGRTIINRQRKQIRNVR